MHTAICTFEDRALAEQSVERLLRSGFERHAVHLEHRHADGTPMPEGDSGTERRDHDVKGKFGFFERLFGSGRHAPHAETYSSAVERGLYVVVVETSSEQEAGRAQDVLHGMEARDMNMVHREGERPLRELIAEREFGGSDIERSFGTARADMAASHNRDMRDADFVQPDRMDEPERAMASQGWGEQRRLDVVDDDKPIASPELPLTDPVREDKPR